MIERPLWYSVILHAYYTAGPSKLCCHEESLDATDLTTFEYTGVENHFLSFGIGYFPSNISGGTDRASVYDVCTVSMTRSHTAKL